MIPSAAKGCAEDWSPASVEGKPKRRKSTRRSISDLSPTARMTPKELEARGLGVPWRKPESALCSTLDMQMMDEDALQARQFCLLPSPELQRGRGAMASGSRTPSISPETEQLQRRFSEGLRAAAGLAEERLGDASECCQLRRRSRAFTSSSTRSPSPSGPSSQRSSLATSSCSWPCEGTVRERSEEPAPLPAAAARKRRSSLLPTDASWAALATKAQDPAGSSGNRAKRRRHLRCHSSKASSSTTGGVRVQPRTSKACKSKLRRPALGLQRAYMLVRRRVAVAAAAAAVAVSAAA